MAVSEVAVGVVAAILGALLAALACRRLAGPALQRQSERVALGWRADVLDVETKEALARSEAVVRGQVHEQLVPLLAGFPYRAGDSRFLGKPVDFIVFDGYREVLAGERSSLRSVVFLDVKTGGALLSTVERRIRDCVEAGRVRCVSLDSPPAVQP